MVRRQTRVQKRNRRQQNKSRRNNRRQNKSLRRKRQSRRKLRGGVKPAAARAATGTIIGPYSTNTGEGVSNRTISNLLFEIYTAKNEYHNEPDEVLELFMQKYVYGRYGTTIGQKYVISAHKLIYEGVIKPRDGWFSSFGNYFTDDDVEEVRRRVRRMENNQEMINDENEM